VESNIPADWEFVQNFIDREHARIDAEFERQLAWHVAEAATAPPRPRYVAPYAGVYGGGYLYPFRYPGGWSRPTPHDGHPRSGLRPAGARHGAQGARPPASQPAAGRRHR
jgi:hypothetical protein